MDESTTSGTLDLCLKYQDETKVLTEETDGVLLEGTWFAIDDKRLIITLESAINVALISKGIESDRAKYSLSYGGESLIWLSNNSTGLLGRDDAGFVSELPATNDECATLLTR